MDLGAATWPITDFEAYRQKLSGFVNRSGFLMRPIFDTARREHMRASKRSSMPRANTLTC